VTEADEVAAPLIAAARRFETLSGAIAWVRSTQTA